LNSYIPLDCIIVIEFSKMFFVSIMNKDVEMKTIDPQTGELVEFESHNYNLLEDTAEIEYIFADKTGTLTKNELQFRCITLVTDAGDDT
jgi:magnesium-transporting ATPase (P-type)